MSVQRDGVTSTQRQHGARRDVAEVVRIELPIAAALPEAHRVVGTQIERSEKLYDLFFREMPEYPTLVWLLVRLLVQCGIMREEGEGVLRVFEETAESFLPPAS